MMFGKMIRHIVGSLLPINLELMLFDTINHTIKLHVESLDLFLRIVLLTNTSAVLLSIFKGVGPYLCTNSSNATLMGIAALPLLFIVPASASPVEDIYLLRT